MKKVLSFALILCLVVLSTGCAPKPDSSVNAYFAALAKGDYKTADTYVKGETKFDNEVQEKISKKLTSMLKVKVLESTTENDKATVTAEVTAADMKVIVKGMFAEVLPKLLGLAFSGAPDVEQQSTDMMFNYMVTELEKPDVKLITSKVSIQLTYDKDKKLWIIQKNDALADAMTGGMATAFKQISDNMKAQQTPSKSDVKPDPTLYKIGQEAKSGRAAITVLEATKSAGSTYEKPKKGMEYLIVKVKDRNVGNNGPIGYDTTMFKMQNSKGQITSNVFSTIDSDTAFPTGSLVPGGEVEGTLVFEVPIGDPNLVFSFTPETEALLSFKIE